MVAETRHPTVIDAKYELVFLLLNQCIEKWQLLIPAVRRSGEDAESRKRNHLKFRWIPAFAGMTGLGHIPE